MKLLLLFLPSIFAYDQESRMTKKEHEDAVGRIFKYIYAHEHICGNLFKDQNWMPAGMDCTIPCEYTSNVCMTKSHDRADPYQLCRQLPARCVEGIQRHIRSSFIMPAQPHTAFVDSNSVIKAQMKTVPAIQSTVSERKTERLHEINPLRFGRGKTIDTAQIESNQENIFGPPRPGSLASFTPGPSSPPGQIPPSHLLDTNPYMKGRRGFLGNTLFQGEPSSHPSPPSNTDRENDNYRTANGSPSDKETKDDPYRLSYESNSIDNEETSDQPVQELPIILVDDDVKSNAYDKNFDESMKLVEASDEDILGGFQHSSGTKVDLFASCCQWAVAGLCDSQWRKVRHVCPKSCGTMVCEEGHGMRACSRILDVDITECYDSLPRMIGLRKDDVSDTEQKEIIDSLHQTTRDQLYLTSNYLTDRVKSRHTSSPRSTTPSALPSTWTIRASTLHPAPSPTVNVVKPQKRKSGKTTNTSTKPRPKSDSVVLINRGTVSNRRFEQPSEETTKFLRVKSVTSAPIHIRKAEVEDIARTGNQTNRKRNLARHSASNRISTTEPVVKNMNQSLMDRRQNTIHSGGVIRKRRIGQARRFVH